MASLKLNKDVVESPSVNTMSPVPRRQGPVSFKIRSRADESVEDHYEERKGFVPPSQRDAVKSRHIPSIESREKSQTGCGDAKYIDLARKRKTDTEHNFSWKPYINTGIAENDRTDIQAVEASQEGPSLLSNVARPDRILSKASAVYPANYYNTSVPGYDLSHEPSSSGFISDEIHENSDPSLQGHHVQTNLSFRKTSSDYRKFKMPKSYVTHLRQADKNFKKGSVLPQKFRSHRNVQEIAFELQHSTTREPSIEDRQEDMDCEGEEEHCTTYKSYKVGDNSQKKENREKTSFTGEDFSSGEIFEKKESQEICKSKSQLFDRMFPVRSILARIIPVQQCAAQTVEAPESDLIGQAAPKKDGAFIPEDSELKAEVNDTKKQEQFFMWNTGARDKDTVKGQGGTHMSRDSLARARGNRHKSGGHRAIPCSNTEWVAVGLCEKNPGGCFVPEAKSTCLHTPYNTRRTSMIGTRQDKMFHSNVPTRSRGVSVGYPTSICPGGRFGEKARQGRQRWASSGRGKKDLELAGNVHGKTRVTSILRPVDQSLGETHVSGHFFGVLDANENSNIPQEIPSYLKGYSEEEEEDISIQLTSQNPSFNEGTNFHGALMSAGGYLGLNADFPEPMLLSHSIQADEKQSVCTRSLVDLGTKNIVASDRMTSLRTEAKMNGTCEKGTESLKVPHVLSSTGRKNRSDDGKTRVKSEFPPKPKTIVSFVENVLSGKDLSSKGNPASVDSQEPSDVSPSRITCKHSATPRKSKSKSEKLPIQVSQRPRKSPSLSLSQHKPEPRNTSSSLPCETNSTAKKTKSELSGDKKYDSHHNSVIQNSSLSNRQVPKYESGLPIANKTKSGHETTSMDSACTKFESSEKVLRKANKDSQLAVDSQKARTPSKTINSTVDAKPSALYTGVHGYDTVSGTMVDRNIVIQDQENDASSEDDCDQPVNWDDLNSRTNLVHGQQQEHDTEKIAVPRSNTNSQYPYAEGGLLKPEQTRVGSILAQTVSEQLGVQTQIASFSNPQLLVFEKGQASESMLEKKGPITDNSELKTLILNMRPGTSTPSACSGVLEERHKGVHGSSIISPQNNSLLESMRHREFASASPADRTREAQSEKRREIGILSRPATSKHAVRNENGLLVVPFKGKPSSHTLVSDRGQGGQNSFSQKPLKTQNTLTQKAKITHSSFASVTKESASRGNSKWSSPHSILNSRRYVEEETATLQTPTFVESNLKTLEQQQATDVKSTLNSKPSETTPAENPQSKVSKQSGSNTLGVGKKVGIFIGAGIKSAKDSIASAISGKEKHKRLVEEDFEEETIPVRVTTLQSSPVSVGDQELRDVEQLNPFNTSYLPDDCSFNPPSNSQTLLLESHSAGGSVAIVGEQENEDSVQNKSSKIGILENVTKFSLALPPHRLTSRKSETGQHIKKEKYGQGINRLHYPVQKKKDLSVPSPPGKPSINSKQCIVTSKADVGSKTSSALTPSTPKSELGECIKDKDKFRISDTKGGHHSVQKKTDVPGSASEKNTMNNKIKILKSEKSVRPPRTLSMEDNAGQNKAATETAEALTVTPASQPQKMTSPGVDLKRFPSLSSKQSSNERPMTPTLPSVITVKSKASMSKSQESTAMKAAFVKRETRKPDTFERDEQKITDLNINTREDGVLNRDSRNSENLVSKSRTGDEENASQRKPDQGRGYINPSPASRVNTNDQNSEKAKIPEKRDEKKDIEEEVDSNTFVSNNSREVSSNNIEKTQSGGKASLLGAENDKSGGIREGKNSEKREEGRRYRPAGTKWEDGTEIKDDEEITHSVSPKTRGRMGGKADSKSTNTKFKRPETTNTASDYADDSVEYGTKSSMQSASPFRSVSHALTDALVSHLSRLEMKYRKKPQNSLDNGDLYFIPSKKSRASKGRINSNNDISTKLLERSEPAMAIDNEYEQPVAQDPDEDEFYFNLRTPIAKVERAPDQRSADHIRTPRPHEMSTYETYEYGYSKPRSLAKHINSTTKYTTTGSFNKNPQQEYQEENPEEELKRREQDEIAYGDYKIAKQVYDERNKNSERLYEVIVLNTKQHNKPGGSNSTTKSKGLNTKPLNKAAGSNPKHGYTSGDRNVVSQDGKEGAKSKPTTVASLVSSTSNKDKSTEQGKGDQEKKFSGKTQKDSDKSKKKSPSFVKKSGSSSSRSPSPGPRKNKTESPNSKPRRKQESTGRIARHPFRNSPPKPMRSPRLTPSKSESKTDRRTGKGEKNKNKETLKNKEAGKDQSKSASAKVISTSESPQEPSSPRRWGTPSRAKSATEARTGRQKTRSGEVAKNKEQKEEKSFWERYGLPWPTSSWISEPKNDPKSKTEEPKTEEGIFRVLQKQLGRLGLSNTEQSSTEKATKKPDSKKGSRSNTPRRSSRYKVSKKPDINKKPEVNSKPDENSKPDNNVTTDPNKKSDCVGAAWEHTKSEPVSPEQCVKPSTPSGQPAQASSRKSPQMNEVMHYAKRGWPVVKTLQGKEVVQKPEDTTSQTHDLQGSLVKLLAEIDNLKVEMDASFRDPFGFILEEQDKNEILNVKPEVLVAFDDGENDDDSDDNDVILQPTLPSEPVAELSEVWYSGPSAYHREGKSSNSMPLTEVDLYFGQDEKCEYGERIVYGSSKEKNGEMAEGGNNDEESYDDENEDNSVGADTYACGNYFRRNLLREDKRFGDATGIEGSARINLPLFPTPEYCSIDVISKRNISPEGNERNKNENRRSSCSVPDQEWGSEKANVVETRRSLKPKTHAKFGTSTFSTGRTMASCARKNEMSGKMQEISTHSSALSKDGTLDSSSLVESFSFSSHPQNCLHARRDLSSSLESGPTPKLIHCGACLQADVVTCPTTYEGVSVVCDDTPPAGIMNEDSHKYEEFVLGGYISSRHMKPSSLLAASYKYVSRTEDDVAMISYPKLMKMNYTCHSKSFQYDPTVADSNTCERKAQRTIRTETLGIKSDQVQHGSGKERKKSPVKRRDKSPKSPSRNNSRKCSKGSKSANEPVLASDFKNTTSMLNEERKFVEEAIERYTQARIFASFENFMQEKRPCYVENCGFRQQQQPGHGDVTSLASSISPAAGKELKMHRDQGSGDSDGLDLASKSVSLRKSRWDSLSKECGKTVRQAGLGRSTNGEGQVEDWSSVKVADACDEKYDRENTKSEDGDSDVCNVSSSTSASSTSSGSSISSSGTYGSYNTRIGGYGSNSNNSINSSNSSTSVASSSESSVCSSEERDTNTAYTLENDVTASCVPVSVSGEGSSSTPQLHSPGVGVVKEVCRSSSDQICKKGVAEDVSGDEEEKEEEEEEEEEEEDGDFYEDQEDDDEDCDDDDEEDCDEDGEDDADILEMTEC